MRAFSRLVLRHRILVVGFWLAVLAVGIPNLQRATDAFSQDFSVPGREGFETNRQILARFGVDTLTDAIVPVIALPEGTSASGVRAQLAEAEASRRKALAAGIILDATVVRSLLAPALMALFGRWNWWLPGWAATLLRVAPSQPTPEQGRDGKPRSVETV